MAVATVVCEPLSAAAFAPFGQVLSAGLGQAAAANQGTAVRYDWAANLENLRPGARPNLAIFRSIARTLPLELKLLERHPASTQAFLPLVVGRMLVCVAPTADDGGPDLTGLRAFLGAPGQGVNYALGVWHHPIVALDRDADLAMLAWEDGTALDCLEHWFDAPRLVVEGSTA
ncbi:MAG: ureidoglycolate lyase [Deltaproteobacteria bacterium]|nr:ureidoglycolate lyase [Deltaproteobacteria bacterium]